MLIPYHAVSETSPVADGESLVGCLTPSEQLAAFFEAGRKYRFFKCWDKVKVGWSERRLTDQGFIAVKFDLAKPATTIPRNDGIPRSLATRSQRINAWIAADEPAMTICRNDAGYKLKEVRIGPNTQAYRILTGREKKRHFGLIWVNPEKPCPTIQMYQPQSNTTGLVHPYEIRHLTIGEIKLMTSFPAGFRLEGSFHKKWARVGNSVPPLFTRAIALHIRTKVLPGTAAVMNMHPGLDFLTLSAAYGSM